MAAATAMARPCRQQERQRDHGDGEDDGTTAAMAAAA